METTNVELFVYCLWRLGAAGRFVEIEDIYEEAFRVAPSRFSWRTKEYPSDKIAAQALRHARIRFGSDFILTSADAHSLQLTAKAVQWVQDRLPQLEALADKSHVVGANRPSQRQVITLEKHPLVQRYAAGEDVDATRAKFADALRVAPDADPRAWRERLETFRSAAQSSGRPSVLAFCDRLEKEHPEWFGASA